MLYVLLIVGFYSKTRVACCLWDRRVGVYYWGWEFRGSLLRVWFKWIWRFRIGFTDLDF